MDFFSLPLITAMTAIIFAQAVKVPIRYIVTKEFMPNLIFSTGGMPSSHSAAVCALTTSVGFLEGVGSNIFAIAFVFSVIIMFDASGIRRHAGNQAVVLNQLIKDFQAFVEGAKDWKDKAKFKKRQELKELLGHQPIEVFFGGLTGVIIAILLLQTIATGIFE